jgi:hypothetical protein
MSPPDERTDATNEPSRQPRFSTRQFCAADHACYSLPPNRLSNLTHVGHLRAMAQSVGARAQPQMCSSVEQAHLPQYCRLIPVKALASNHVISELDDDGNVHLDLPVAGWLAGQQPVHLLGVREAEV